jgi:hypothetical protein
MLKVRHLPMIMVIEQIVSSIDSPLPVVRVIVTSASNLISSDAKNVFAHFTVLHGYLDG